MHCVNSDFLEAVVLWPGFQPFGAKIRKSRNCCPGDGIFVSTVFLIAGGRDFRVAAIDRAV